MSVDTLTTKPRLNVLLTEDRPHDAEYWTIQLARLLEPMGVVAYLAQTGREALELVGQLDIHVAVIDLGTPKAKGSTRPAEGERAGRSLPLAVAHSAAPGGLWLLEQFRRLPRRPPVVVVDQPMFDPTHAERLLRDVLRLGAFSVLHKPVELEQLLGVLQRLLERRYSGQWPTRRSGGES
jgi:CheY-like chemotaxis protein